MGLVTLERLIQLNTEYLVTDYNLKSLFEVVMVQKHDLNSLRLRLLCQLLGDNPGSLWIIDDVCDFLMWTGATNEQT